MVDGGKSINFCLRYPRTLLVFVGGGHTGEHANGVLRAGTGCEDGVAGHLVEKRFGLDAAEADGTLDLLASTYSADNHAVYDGRAVRGRAR